MTRDVRFYREPHLSSHHRSQRLGIELLELAHAAISETLQTGGPASAMLSQIEALLLPHPSFVWRGNGPGLGRELRRSYSNIHGRYMGRYYLEHQEKVGGLLPIEGDRFHFDGGNAVVGLRPNEMGDMPDWVGWDDSGFVIAEAKGTYAQGDWANSFWGWNAKPQCVQKAQAQVARVKIDIYGVALDVAFKSWVVASRWATEMNSLDPWLVAIDPPYGQSETPPATFSAIILRMQRIIFQRALETLGLSAEGDAPTAVGRGSELTFDAAFQVPYSYISTLKLHEEEPLRGVCAAVGKFGFLILQSDRELEFARLVGNDNLVVVIEEAPMVRAQQGTIVSNSEIRRTPTVVARNGIAVSRLGQVRSVVA